jgi:predicted GH43/DUF377 family glycosyl hydrolase
MADTDYVSLFTYSHIRQSLEKVLFLFLFLILLLYPESSLNAWFRSDYPIITYSNTRWDSYHNINPFVRFDGNYKIWYVGNGGMGWRIGYGSSLNGHNWNLFPSAIMSPNQNWERELTQTVVIYENNIYRMWYSTQTDNYDKLGYASSINGYDNWLKNPNPVFNGNLESWDINVTNRGFSIVKNNNNYHLWYAGRDRGTNWRIGYATSYDGISWNRQNNSQPVITPTTSCDLNNVSYPNVIYENGIYKMWYAAGLSDLPTQFCYAESLDGITWNKSPDTNFVFSTRTSKFDSTRLSQPYVLKIDNTYKMWYSGFDGTHWSIGYATASADPIVPIPTPLEPVVIVPGMMASWNKEGILEGQTNPTTPWKILPFVKEYEGLIQTLKNLGYEEGKNLFVWPYDWRKSISSLTQKLEEYIQSTVKPHNPNSKIQLVGHSLGGLVTRSWSQTNDNGNSIHHLINVATPEKGTIQPYKLWSGGDISQENSFLSLAGKMMLELNRRSFGTTREVIQNTVPSFRDILPTEPYLKRQNGSSIPISEMKLKNTWLTNLNLSSASVSGILSVIRGVGFSSTPNMYKIEPPLWLDQALGNWQDGKPVSTEYADGDNVIPSSRSILDTRATDVSLSHANSIAAKNGIKTILELLEIPASDSAITAGKETTIQPGLLFLLRSPATVQVVFNGMTYMDFDGIIFIPNAQSGMYDVTVTGTDTGTYRLAVGQFTETAYTWKEYTGETTNNKKTSYTIQFNASIPSDDPVTNLSDEERLNQIDLQLIELSKRSANTLIPKIRYILTLAVSALSKKDFLSLKNYLEQIILDLSALRKTNLSSSARSQTFTVFDALIDAYQAILVKKQYVINQSVLLRLQTICNAETLRLDSVLAKQFAQKKSITQKVQTFLEARNYKSKAESTGESEKPKKYILLYLTQTLLREIGL